MQLSLLDTVVHSPAAGKKASDSMNILCPFDLTGNWPHWYKQNGYTVESWDLQAGIDLLTVDYRTYPRDYFGGILAAVPCTEFANCGAMYFDEKDNDGRTYEAMVLTYKTLAIVSYFSPGLRFWCIENPSSRIHKLCPDLGNVKYKFHPWEYAGYAPDPASEQYAKATWLWGRFNKPTKKPLPCLISGIDRHSQWGGHLKKRKTDAV